MPEKAFSVCIKDSVFIDPAMGSAGFIAESANYIQEHFEKELLKKENAEHYKTTMFSGFDTDQTMLRIGAMNMMLHGVEEPNIKYQDTILIKLKALMLNI